MNFLLIIAMLEKYLHCNFFFSIVSVELQITSFIFCSPNLPLAWLSTAKHQLRVKSEKKHLTISLAKWCGSLQSSATELYLHFYWRCCNIGIEWHFTEGNLPHNRSTSKAFIKYFICTQNFVYNNFLIDFKLSERSWQTVHSEHVFLFLEGFRRRVQRNLECSGRA